MNLIVTVKEKVRTNVKESGTCGDRRSLEEAREVSLLLFGCSKPTECVHLRIHNETLFRNSLIANEANFRVDQ